MDRSCSELTFIFMNARWRSLTGQDILERRLIQQMRNPPQGEQYRVLLGPLFPEEFPFRYSQIFSFGYFWHKYFISQRLYYCIPKRQAKIKNRPIYVNYEILTHCFQGGLIDLQQTRMNTIPFDCSKPSRELIKFLTAQNLYSKQKFKERLQKLKQIKAEKQRNLQEENKVNIEVEKLKETLTPEIKNPYKKEAEINQKIEEQIERDVRPKQVERGWFGRIFQKLRKT